jgi:hypothetical protein
MKGTSYVIKQRLRARVCQGIAAAWAAVGSHCNEPIIAQKTAWPLILACFLGAEQSDGFGWTQVRLGCQIWNHINSGYNHKLS